MFWFITWIIFSLSWSLLHVRIVITVFILTCLEAVRTLRVCEVQNKKSVEKYLKLPFALAVIAGSGFFLCEKNRLLQSCLDGVSWALSCLHRVSPACLSKIWTQTTDLNQKQNSPELLPSLHDWWLTPSYKFIMQSDPPLFFFLVVLFVLTHAYWFYL